MEEEIAKSLEAMGYTIGANTAYLTGVDGAPAWFLWPPGVLPTQSGGWRALGPLTSQIDECFDDPMTAAAWLLVERSNWVG